MQKKAGHDSFLPDLRALLIERMSHWKAVARRMLTTYHAEIKRRTEQPGANQAEPTPTQNSGKTTPSEESKSTNKQHKALEDREQKIWEVIQRGLRGKAYCREVDAAKVSPPRKGVWEGAPRTYVAAYVSRDQRLVHWIQNEKSKIRRKAELLDSHKTRCE